MEPWVIGLVIVSVLTYLGVVREHGLAGDGFDFRSVWQAGDRLVAGISPWESTTRVGDFVQPPSTPIFAAPFGLLPLDTARVLMVIVCAAAFSVAVIRGAAVDSRRPRYLPYAALLVFSLSGPFREEIRLSNTDLLAAAMLTLGVAQVTRARPLIGGAALGIGLAIKPTMAVLLALPLLIGAVGGTLVALATVLAVNGIGLLLAADSGRFFSSALPYLLEGDTGGYNVSLKSALGRLGVGDVLVTATRAVVGIALIGLFRRFGAQFRAKPEVLALALVLCAPLLSSYFFARYFCYLVVAIGAVMMFRESRRAAMAASLAGVLILTDVTLRSGNEFVDDVLGLRYVAAAALGLAAIAWAFHDDARGRDEASADPGVRPLPVGAR